MRIPPSVVVTGLAVGVLAVGAAAVSHSAAAGVPGAQSGADVAATAAAATRGRPLALVYRGPAACDGCPEAAAELLRSTSFGFHVRYVGPGETLRLTPSSLSRAALYVQPGGGDDVAAAYRSLGALGRRAIISYVRSGGHYLGICMGGYLAGSDPGLGLLSPGDSGWYIKTKGASTTNTRDTVIPIEWGSTLRDMYFQDGPFLRPSRVAGERILARYTNGRVAALVRPVGTGRIGVVGPHPEAPRGWYRYFGMLDRDSDGLDADLGRELINEVMK